MRPKSVIALVLAVASLALGGCGWNEWVGDKLYGKGEVRAPAQLGRIAVASEVTDASTGDPIAGNVTVTLFGAAARRAVDGSGNSVCNTSNPAEPVAGPFSATGGVFVTYLKPDPNDTFPMELRVVAKAAGFATSSATLMLEQSQFPGDGTGLLPIQIRLVNLDTGAPNVAAYGGTTITVAPSGTLAQPVSVETAPMTVAVGAQTENVGTATLDIPAGVQLLTAAGQPVSGNVEVNVLYNNNVSADSLLSFPGGFFVGEDPTGDSSRDGTFVSGGFAAVEITDGQGHKVRKFSSPVDMTITVPASTVNPKSATGDAVKVGDKVPIWFFDEDTGAWHVQKDTSGNPVQGTLVAAGDGNYQVTFPTDHLSYFNLDWWFWGGGEEDCNGAIRVHGHKGNRIFFVAELAGRGWAHDWWLDAGITADPATDTVRSAPKGKMKVTGYLNDKSGPVVGTWEGRICDGVDFNVDASKIPASTKYADLRVTVEELCPGSISTKKPVEGATVQAHTQGQGTIFALTDANGVAVLPHLIVGATYKLSAHGRDGRGNDWAEPVTIKETGNATVAFQLENAALCPVPPTPTFADVTVYVREQCPADISASTVVSGATVTATGAGLDTVTAKTDATGKATLRLQAGKSYAVTAQDSGNQLTQSISVKDGTNPLISFNFDSQAQCPVPQYADVAVSVAEQCPTDTTVTRAVANVTVTATAAGTSPVTVTTDGGGKATFQKLLVGATFNFSVTVNGQQKTATRTVLAAGTSVPPFLFDNDAVCTIVPQTGDIGVSAVWVCPADHTKVQAISGAPVTAAAAGEPSVTTSTDDQGNATLQQLVAGTSYTLAVSPVGASPLTRQVTVLPAGNALQVFEFDRQGLCPVTPPKADVTVSVVGACATATGGTPVALEGVKVTATIQGFDPVTVTTDTNGHAVFPQLLVDGTYTFSLVGGEPPASQSQQYLVKTTGNSLSFQLGWPAACPVVPPVSLNVAVREECTSAPKNQAPVSGATVTATPINNPQAAQGSGVTGTDGSAILQNLTANQLYQIVVTKGAVQLYSGQATTGSQDTGYSVVIANPNLCPTGTGTGTGSGGSSPLSELSK